MLEVNRCFNFLTSNRFDFLFRAAGVGRTFQKWYSYQKKRNKRVQQAFAQQDLNIGGKDYRRKCLFLLFTFCRWVRQCTLGNGNQGMSIWKFQAWKSSPFFWKPAEIAAFGKRLTLRFADSFAVHNSQMFWYLL